MTKEKIAAWSVHLYTASGLVLASMIAVLIVRGDTQSLFWALLWMWVATIVDATDGVLARKARVKEVLPYFDGRRLDDLVDFINYTFLPLFFVWRAGILTPGTEGFLIAPLMASAYGFCQSSAKTDDGFFLGFPSYWNIVAMYLFILRPPPPVALAFLLGFAFLTFIPTKYLYSTQPGKLNRYTNVLAVVWTFMIGWMLYEGASGHKGPEGLESIAYASLAFPVYYLGASWVVTLQIWRSRARTP